MHNFVRVSERPTSTAAPCVGLLLVALLTWRTATGADAVAEIETITIMPIVLSP